MKTFTNFCYVMGGLVTGNYVWQLFSEFPNWNTAFERSYFQLAAGLVVYFLFRGKDGTKFPNASG